MFKILLYVHGTTPSLLQHRSLFIPCVVLFNAVKPVYIIIVSVKAVPVKLNVASSVGCSHVAEVSKQPLWFLLYRRIPPEHPSSVDTPVQLLWNPLLLQYVITEAYYETWLCCECGMLMRNWLYADTSDVKGNSGQPGSYFHCLIKLLVMMTFHFLCRDL